MRITPSILSCDPAEFRPAVRAMVAAGVDGIHFDVMDGQFVPPITFGADLVCSLRSEGTLPFDVHLMTHTPELHFEAFHKAGCERIAFHVEATVHSHRLMQELKSRGLEASIALNPGTPAEAIYPLLDLADAVLVMTVNPGWGGQSLIRSTLEKIAQIRAWRPDVEIHVDGGVDHETIVELAAAGATAFVTGSYLMRAPSIAEGVARLRNACGSKSS
jgi:ribulose-phosphate 3-epimerase